MEKRLRPRPESSSVQNGQSKHFEKAMAHLPHDQVSAFKWFKIASFTGSTTAKSKIDELELVMSTTDIELGLREARAYFSESLSKQKN